MAGDGPAHQSDTALAALKDMPASASGPAAASARSQIQTSTSSTPANHFRLTVLRFDQTGRLEQNRAPAAAVWQKAVGRTA